MRISLPALIELTCPTCHGKATVTLAALNRKLELNCPFCREGFKILDAVSGKLRRKVYYALRDNLEQAVYLEYRKQHSDYFDEWGTLAHGDPPAASPTENDK